VKGEVLHGFYIGNSTALQGCVHTVLTAAETVGRPDSMNWYKFHLGEKADEEHVPVHQR